VKVLVVAQADCIREAMVGRFTDRNRPYACADLRLLSEAQATRQLITSSSIDLVVCALQGAGAIDDTLIAKAAELAQVCGELGLPLIQLSSASVFDGCDSAGPFQEEAMPVPLSHQAVLLARLEELISGACHQSIILRSGKLFSAKGDNHLTQLMTAFAKQQVMALPDDGLGSPVNPFDLARVVSALIDQISCGTDAWGVYHYACSDPVSYFHFAETSLAVASQYIDTTNFTLEVSETHEIVNDWLSPQLNCQKLLNTFGVKQLPWRSSINPEIQRYLTA
jgi:dTDP-4-dehydrorhamnose reductase